MMAVRAAPASRPRMGLEKAVRMPVNFSFWARGETEVMVRMTPMAARIGEKELGFRSFRNRLLP